MKRGAARIEINEVGPRDGLQIEKTFVATADKIDLIDRLSECGFARIEVTSFTSARAIPALADAEAVLAGIGRRAGTRYTALVPTMRHLERALPCGLDEVNLVMSASETHNRANLRMTRDQSRAELTAMLARAAEHGIACNVSLSTAFGCPFDGDVAPDAVLDVAGALVAAGASGVTLCDTTGMAYPDQVAQLSADFIDAHPDIALTLHLHDTRGMALANALAGWQAGVVRFDAAVGGLGGCPFAPGASGNVSTEALVHMFQCMGVDTGVDLTALLAVAGGLSGLVARPVPVPLAIAGTRWQTHPRPVGLI